MPRIEDVSTVTKRLGSKVFVIKRNGEFNGKWEIVKGDCVVTKVSFLTPNGIKEKNPTAYEVTIDGNTRINVLPHGLFTTLIEATIAINERNKDTIIWTGKVNPWVVWQLINDRLIQRMETDVICDEVLKYFNLPSSIAANADKSPEWSREQINVACQLLTVCANRALLAQTNNRRFCNLPETGLHSLLIATLKEAILAIKIERRDAEILMLEG